MDKVSRRSFIAPVMGAAAGVAAVSVLGDTNPPTAIPFSQPFREPRRILWTGNAGDHDWSNADNWDGGVIPQEGDTVLFTATA